MVSKKPYSTRDLQQSLTRHGALLQVSHTLKRLTPTAPHKLILPSKPKVETKILAQHSSEGNSPQFEQYIDEKTFGSNFLCCRESTRQEKYITGHERDKFNTYAKWMFLFSLTKKALSNKQLLMRKISVTIIYITECFLGKNFFNRTRK